MDIRETIEYLQQEFNTKDTGVLYLHAIQNMIEKATSEEAKKEAGIMAAALAGMIEKEQTPDQLLLEFFGTTQEAVLESVGDEFLQNNGIYRSLVTSPQLSPMCELFFDAWLLAVYEENPVQCHIRRVGVDAFRVVATLPGGGEMEYPEDMTLDLVVECTNCPNEDLQKMPVLQ